MTGWGSFAVAGLAFLLTHFVPARPAIRARLIATLGRRLWFSLYGLISLAVTAWVIAAASQAPFVELWPQLPWTRWVPNLIMPIAIALAVSGLPSRTVTLGGRRTPRVDVADPGLAALTRHPLLWALALWSGSHLLPNGDLAHVLLFGGFLAMALAGMAAFDRRARTRLSAEEAGAYFASTAIFAPRALVRATSGRWDRGNLARLILALGLWPALLLLHPYVIGLSPLPI
ncbi:NnrU family protein [Rubellimicrobium arenae]|uniref:NnrU family protein n=1 Tax=Rubellimicrobium arenae TaxID=2817372 RepID=UPI001B316A73|nr:NnrU family protein [Rubellimicrobium arenae]